jgi:hypothetical protein
MSCCIRCEHTEWFQVAPHRLQWRNIVNTLVPFEIVTYHTVLCFNLSAVTLSEYVIIWGWNIFSTVLTCFYKEREFRGIYLFTSRYNSRHSLLKYILAQHFRALFLVFLYWKMVRALLVTNFKEAIPLCENLEVYICLRLDTTAVVSRCKKI